MRLACVLGIVFICRAAVGADRPFAFFIDTHFFAVIIDHGEIERGPFGAVVLVVAFQFLGDLIKPLPDVGHGKRRIVLAANPDFECRVLFGPV